MASDSRLYRRRVGLITGGLLAAWLLVTLLVGCLARDLGFSFFGWPFSFWLGAQGSLIVYVLIVCCYARWMNRLDRESGRDGPPADEP